MLNQGGKPINKKWRTNFCESILRFSEPIVAKLNYFGEDLSLIITLNKFLKMRKLQLYLFQLLMCESHQNLDKLAVKLLQ